MMKLTLNQTWKRLPLAAGIASAALALSSLGAPAAEGDEAGDGKGKRPQRGQMLSRVFEKFDADDSGGLSKTEFEAMQAARAEGPRAKEGKGEGDRPRGRRGRRGRRGQGGEEHTPPTFDELDADGSGEITKNELAASMKNRRGGRRGQPREGRRGRRGPRGGDSAES